MKLEFCEPSDDAYGPLGSLLNDLVKAKQSYEPQGLWADTLKSAFQTLTEELGIANDERTVCLGFVKDFPGEKDVGGKTDNTKTDKFEVTLRRANPYLCLFTLAHEMVHVRDLATKRMELVDGKHLKYRGVTINDKLGAIGEHGLGALLVPYEREAYALQAPLTLKVLAKLPPDQKAFIEDAYKEDVLPPTFTGWLEEQVEQNSTIVSKLNDEFLRSKAAGKLPPFLQQFNSVTEIT